MLTYPGTSVVVKIGDQVKFEGRSDVLTVTDIIDTEEKKRSCDLDELGISIEGGIYGRVFTAITDEELRFVSRSQPER